MTCLIIIIIVLYFNRYDFDKCQQFRYQLTNLRTLIHPCSFDQSIFVRNNSLYKYNRKNSKWQRICVSSRTFQQSTLTIQSLAHINYDLVLIINGSLYRTQSLVSSDNSTDLLLLRLIYYSNIPILKNTIEYVFTTLCCSCMKINDKTFRSPLLNELILLANRQGHVILFSFKSLTIVYNFGSIFQNQSAKLLYLGLVYAPTKLLAVIQYESQKVMIVSHFLFKSSIQTEHFTFTGKHFHISTSFYPNSYFFWDKTHIYYTINDGEIISKLLFNGCQIDYLDQFDRKQLEIYYQNLNISYENISLTVKDAFCLNISIADLYISNGEFLVKTIDKQWFYGKEIFVPSLIKLSNDCIRNEFYPQIDSNCLLNKFNPSTIPCSSFIQVNCWLIRFESLFNSTTIYHLEKHQQIQLKFRLETYRVIPLLINSRKSTSVDYKIDYEFNRLTNGIIQMIGTIHIRIDNQSIHDELGLNSFRLGLIEYGYACKQSPTIIFQIETSCSSSSSMKIKKNESFAYVNSTEDFDWFKQTYPFHTSSSFIRIKHKLTDPLYLDYIYCFNQTCRTMNHSNHERFLIYAVALNRNHRTFALSLIDRTDSCESSSKLIYYLWIQSIMNQTNRQELYRIPLGQRTFYETLLDSLAISNRSCLFSNPKDPIWINQSLIQQTDDDSFQFLLHIIAYKNSVSFCHLETFVLIEIYFDDNQQYFYRGWIFFLVLFLFICLFVCLLHIYTYYEKNQGKKLLQYHRFNQIDMGQLHQWHDTVEYLSKTSSSLLSNIEFTDDLSRRLKESTTRMTF